MTEAAIHKPIIFSPINFEITSQKLHSIKPKHGDSMSLDLRTYIPFAYGNSRYKPVLQINMEFKVQVGEEKPKKFKSFNDTYQVCAFGLAVGMLYPNKTKIRKKLIIGAIMIIINSAELVWFINYTWLCIQRRDIYNLSRNLAIIVIVLLFFFKSFYVNWKNDDFDDFLKKITRDLLKGNDLEEDYQEIYETYIKQAKYGQSVWIIIPISLSVQFPLYAGIQNIIGSMKSDVAQRHMQHDMELMFLEDVQYDTPWFELVFAYNFLQCFILMPTFVGFDGSFCIATSHLQMKLKLMVHKIQKAFDESQDCFEVQSRLKKAIRDHQEAIEFYNDLHGIYSGWLFTVFLLTSFMISFSLYQIYLSGIELKYLIFAICGVIHMYAPCYFAANLLQMSENLCFDIYITPWEKWSDPIVTHLLIFMIAKSQRPMYLTGKGMVIYNMQLFKSIMQSSYSFFTLITS